MERRRPQLQFEDALDRRLKQQSEFLTDLFTKFFKMKKDELNEFGKSLIFLSSKYDEIAKFENEMRESLDYLCYEFECFKWQVVCSLVRTQGCRKQQQGYLFHTNVIIPHETSQQHTLGF